MTKTVANAPIDIEGFNASTRRFADPSYMRKTIRNSYDFPFLIELPDNDIQSAAIANKLHQHQSLTNQEISLTGHFCQIPTNNRFSLVCVLPSNRIDVLGYTTIVWNIAARTRSDKTIALEFNLEIDMIFSKSDNIDPVRNLIAALHSWIETTTKTAFREIQNTSSVSSIRISKTINPDITIPSDILEELNKITENLETRIANDLTPAKISITIQ